MADVTWRAHPVHPGYEASSDGRARSIDRVVPRRRNGSMGTRFVKGRELKICHPGDNGYFGITLSVENKPMSYYIHRFVCETFHGLQPAPKHEVRHLNGDKTDNRPENLQWGTRSENQLDNVRHGVNPRTKQTHCVNDHEFTPENTYRRPGAPHHRYCRTCIKDGSVRQTAARRLRKQLSTQMRASTA